MSDVPEDEVDPGLSGVVVAHLRLELGERADRVLRCLRTAAALIADAESDVRGLRLAESAAYNIREALNGVVRGRDAAAGGLRSVTDAWRKFNAQITMPDVDLAVAREELDKVLGSVVTDESRASHHQRLLLAYLRDRAGITSSARRGDPVSEYGELRDQANSAVHEDVALSEVASLLTRTFAWFVRVFTPPDHVVESIRALAVQPWRGQEQVGELERLATNYHHLRLFFSEVTDPAWLVALHAAGVAQLPDADGPWPVTGLLDGLAKSNPDSVGALSKRLLADTTRIEKPDRPAARFALLRAAVQIGRAGHHVVEEVARLHSDLMSVRSLSVHAAQEADPTSPVVLQVTDAVLNHVRRFTDGDGYHATVVLEQLQEGATAENIADRTRMLAAKTRRLAQADRARYVTLDLVALTVEPAEHPEPLQLFAHHLARLLSKAQQSGMPASMQLEWLGAMPGQVGGRLRSHAMAGADDILMADKIAHVASQVQYSTATAEDLALVTDILSHNPPPEDLAAWTGALGTPSPAPGGAADPVPLDWARAWRWAAVLPTEILIAWRDAIDHVSQHHGQPNPETLTRDRRPPTWDVRWGQSPHSAEHLATLPPRQSAELV